jgi:hypothetical protein
LDVPGQNLAIGRASQRRDVTGTGSSAVGGLVVAIDLLVVFEVMPALQIWPGEGVLGSATVEVLAVLGGGCSCRNFHEVERNASMDVASRSHDVALPVRRFLLVRLCRRAFVAAHFSIAFVVKVELALVVKVQIVDVGVRRNAGAHADFLGRRLLGNCVQRLTWCTSVQVAVG